VDIDNKCSLSANKCEPSATAASSHLQQQPAASSHLQQQPAAICNSSQQPAAMNKVCNLYFFLLQEIK